MILVNNYVHNVSMYNQWYHEKTTVVLIILYFKVNRNHPHWLNTTLSFPSVRWFDLKDLCTKQFTIFKPLLIVVDIRYFVRTYASLFIFLPCERGPFLKNCYIQCFDMKPTTCLILISLSSRVCPTVLNVVYATVAFPIMFALISNRISLLFILFLL